MDDAYDETEKLLKTCDPENVMADELSSIQEVNSMLLSDVQTKKAPGLDGISNEMMEAFCVYSERISP